MASSELQMVIEMMRANPALGEGSVHDMRAAMEAMTAAMPLPTDARIDAVDAGGVAAEWTAVDGARSDRVLVYLHGGGYNIGSVRTHRMLTTALSRAASLRVLSVDYRLAPEHPFPAAIDDAVAAYRFVLKGGMAPHKVAIAGDSAGGGLTAATLLALRDGGHPLPAAAVCISPWLDLSQSGPSMKTRADSDPIVTEAALDRMAAAYLDGQDARTPNASPMFGELAGLPPILIHVGTAEVLYDDSVRFAERVRQAGGEVELDVWEDMIHVSHAFTPMLPEAGQAIDKIASFLDRRLARD